MPAMFYVLVFLAVILAIEGLMIMTRQGNADPRRVRDRLKALAPTQGGVTQPDGSVMRKTEEKGLFARVMNGVPNGSSLDVLLYRAGMPTTPVRFMLFTVLLGALGYVTLTLVADPVRGCLGVLAGFAPYFVVRSMANKRTRRFEEQLPDTGAGAADALAARRARPRLRLPPRRRGARGPDRNRVRPGRGGGALRPRHAWGSSAR